MKGGMKVKRYCYGFYILIPSVVCVNAAFFQGCVKKGCMGCSATRACGGAPRKTSSLPKAPRHPGCVHPACRAGPTHPPPSAGTQGWKQTALGTLWAPRAQKDLRLL